MNANERIRIQEVLVIKIDKYTQDYTGKSKQVINN